MKKEFIIAVLCFVLMFVGGAFSSSAKAVTLTVNSDGDGPFRDGSCLNSAGCTLREAFQRAQANDEIQFASPYFDSPRTIRLTLGIPLTKGNDGTVNIYGRGADMLTIDGNNNTQIFSVDGSNGYKTLYLHQMTLANGNQSDSSTGGGAIYLRYSELKMDQVVITNCVTAGFGGAIFSNRSNVLIEHSALYNNRSSAYGSAIYSYNDLSNNALLKITNTTISGNSSPNSKGAAIYSLRTEMHILFATITKNSANGGSSAGGIFIDSSCNFAGGCQSYLDINSSIIAENPNVNSPNISGAINAQAYNVLGGNPLLLPLAFNPPRVSTVRGLPTHALDTCSPAINAAAVPPGDTSDEQYDPRVLQGRADIGAYESFLLPCPTSITVTNNNDSGAGSLRQAVNDIGLNGTIDFASGVSNIVLTGGEISIIRDVNIAGDGANQVTVRGNNQSRIFTVPGGKTLNLSKIVLADGNAGGAGGGAIVNYGTLNLTSSAIVNNKAQDAGGGISNIGTLSLTNVTVSGNQSHGKGAGIYNNGGGNILATLVNSTVTNNQNFGYAGAGVWNDNATNTFVVRNSIIDGNFSDQGYAHDFVGNYNNQGYNLIGTRNPQLAPLANNGGATLTHALLCGSAAIDAADPNNGSNPATDQRGAVRPVNGRADIGAFEAGVCVNIVTNGGNSGAGSLRQAILDANTDGVINFASNITNVTLTGGELLINKNLTISGGGTTPLTISGNNQSRIFNVAPGATLNLNRVTITGGNNSGGGAVSNYGTLNVTDSTVSGNNDGGIGNYGGTMTILNSTVSGNNGGGIVSSGLSSLLNSTVSGNRTNGKGAGIYNNGGGGIVATIVNSTITDNHSFGYTGAGVWNDNGSDTFRVRNSIIDGNFSDQGYADDFVGGRTDQGNNLIGSRNPRLAPLGNYGGATQTHALLQNSPALDAGNNCVLTANGCSDNNPALTTDGRGTNAPRKIGTAVDIGAYERNITFNQTTLPGGQTNAPYSQTLSNSRQIGFVESGGYQPTEEKMLASFTFSIVSIAGQQLPPGLTLSADGTISGTPTMGGTFTFIVKATDADGMAGVQQYMLMIAAPTAASVSISGRVLTPDGRGLMNASVILTDASGNTRTVKTNTFGYFHFEEVAAGQTYIFTVVSKHYNFAPQIVNITEDLSVLNFTAQREAV